MGLIKENGYTIKGVEIKPAYAKITRLFMEHGNNVTAYFGVSTTRENLNNDEALEEIPFVCEIDKANDKVFNEVYTKAKQELFNDWEDDIQ